MTTTQAQLNSYLLSVLERSRNKLLDTSRRNRLLNFRETARDVAIIDEMPDQVYQHLVLDENDFSFSSLKKPKIPYEDSPDSSSEEDPAEPDRTLPKSETDSGNLENKYKDNYLQTPYQVRDLESKLRKLFYAHRTNIEETGANNLYLDIGFLEWSENEEPDRKKDGVYSRSPLILVPVLLKKESRPGKTLYKLKFDDQALDTNYTLYEKLKNDFEINLPLIKDEQLPEDYWAEVDDAIASRKNNGWNVIRGMTLGLFRFHKQVMWHDLDPKRWPDHSQLLDKKIIKRILLGPKEGDTLPGQYTEEYNQEENESGEQRKLPLILDADSSQYSALIDAMQLSDGLVIEGPPGTGKSQTISNLIAIALENGLSILFVAEKMAALNVVFNRLEKAGLGDFCLQLHGLKTSKKELLNSLKDRIDLKVDSPDELQKQERELYLIKKELIEFSKAISERVGPEEIPLYDMPWHIEKLKQKLPDNYDGINIVNSETMISESFRNAKNTLDDMGKEWETIPKDARKSWAGFLPDKFEESQSKKLIQSSETVISSSKKMKEWLDEKQTGVVSPSLYQVSRLLSISELNPDEALPDLPTGIKIQFVHTIVHKNLIEKYSAILTVIDEYLSIVRKVNNVFDYASDKAPEYARLLKFHSEILSDACCNSALLLTNLEKEHDAIKEVISNLDLLPENSKPISELTGKIYRTIKDYKTLVEQADKYSGGPPELSLHANESHIKRTVINYLDLARKKNNELINKAKNLHLFNISNDIDTNRVEKSYLVIKEKQDSLFPIFNKDYRAGKKYIRRLMKSPAEYTRKDNFPDNIKRLLDYCKDRDEFAGNKDFKSTLGSLFKGINTNWKVLEKVINFSQWLREEVGDESALRIISGWDAHIEVMQSTKDKLKNTFSIISEYSESHPFPDTVWQRPVTQVSGTLNPWEEKLSNAVNEILKPWCNTNITLGESIKIVKLYKLAITKEDKIENNEEFDYLLKEYWKKSSTNIKLLKKLDSWFKDRLDIGCINIELLKFIFPDADSFRTELFSELIQQAKELYKSVSYQVNELNNIGQINKTDWTGGQESLLSDLTEKQNSAISTVEYLPLMARWGILHKKVEKIGLTEISESVMAGDIHGNLASTAFEYSFHKDILNKKISNNDLLSTFSESSYKNLREKFSDIDKEILNLNSKHIASQLCNTDIPNGESRGKVANFTEKRLIVHEAGKKTRHIPIRQLIKRSSKAIKALKPCFLMSPLSVSQYLAPGEIEFDLVVMDEASQIKPEDSLSSVAKSNKCIIVGDPKQLPPTSFFETESSGIDNEEESSIDDTESILDICLQQFPFRRLRWHYRSQHESLIQFSNEKFYDDDLIVFPSPKGDARDFGVHYTYVDQPSYKSSQNKPEAELIVENIIHHFQRHKDRSLGVAAFNKKQTEYIQLILDERKKQDPVIDELITRHNHTESLFIKNLENVQGDERDVIFISTTYGPEKAGGPVFQRFGPINSDSGDRRLNVVTTRARQRIEVFTSLKPEDIHAGDRASRGVRLLKKYLEYAKTGEIKEYGTTTHSGPDSDFEISVSNIIKGSGYECKPQVGVAGFFIDIGVMHPDRPGEYLLGIECDGATYHSARSIRDRDRLRQEILESKGWFIHRIWSTSWFQSRNIEIDKLKRVIDERLEKDRLIVNNIPDSGDEKEILENAQHVTEEDIKQKEELLTDSLEYALNKFWERNISHYYKDRSKSILSEKMIKHLINKRPKTKEDWFNLIPVNERQNMNTDEKEYLDDILDVIAEYI